MDFMPDKEFHSLFDRINKYVNLQGCNTPADVNECLYSKIRSLKTLAKRGQINTRQVIRQISEYKKLIFSGFGRRTIAEAVADPRGKVALTLQYGRKKAREILLARARRRIGPKLLIRR